MKIIHLNIVFHQSLRYLLHPKYRCLDSFNHIINYRGSIKDVIESLRVPHTQIGRLIVNDEAVNFSYKVNDGDQITVDQHKIPLNPCLPDFLRPTPVPAIRFMVDVNTAKLCSLLRMAGFDATCIPGLNDATIAETAASQQRILLSRDRGLLKRKIVVHGHLVRANLPEEQLREIITLYGLYDHVKPFCRCISCNGILQPVQKEKINHRLEPLTKKYYHTFYLCPGCNKIYWPGSHKSRMHRQLIRILDGI